MAYSPRAADALALMYTLHAAQHRKGGEIPYITHLLGVAALVGEYGGDEDQFIAALLHDAAEDQGGLDTLDQIRVQFGDRVAAYVHACSDTYASPKPPWRERKAKHLDGMAAYAPEAKLILAADKLHNARTIMADLRAHGNVVWDRFNGGKEGTLWYYVQAVQALGQQWRHPLLEELERTVTALGDLAQHVE